MSSAEPYGVVQVQILAAHWGDIWGVVSLLLTGVCSGNWPGHVGCPGLPHSYETKEKGA